MSFASSALFGGYAPSGSALTPEKQGRGEGFGQGGGYSSGPTSGAAGQKQGAPRQVESCVPVTIRLIREAVAVKGRGDEELRFHGHEAGQCVLVGAVEGLVEQVTGLELTLNDATGRLRVRHFFQAGSRPKALEGLASGGLLRIDVFRLRKRKCPST